MAFEGNVLIGAAPLLVQFSDTTVGNIAAWYWTFGDGETSTDQNPTHLYPGSGRYDVTLEVTYVDTTTELFEEDTYILVDSNYLEANTKCLRYATEQSEGYGWSEFDGDNIAIPMHNNGAMTIVDDVGQKRDLIIDINDFGIYEIDTCDRFINLLPSPVDKDIEEVSWEKWERETVFDQTEENRRIKHEDSHIGIRPSTPAHRGAPGYTATGLRAAQSISLDAYANGEKIVPVASSGKIIEDGEITFTNMSVNENRVQMVIKGTAGQVCITNHVHNFLGVIGSPEPAKRLAGDYDIQKELATGKVLWITRGIRPLLSRCTGITLNGGTVSVILGPDSRYSGFTCTENILCDNPVVATEGTIVLWSKDTNLITGMADWSTYGAAKNGWTLYYKKFSTGIPEGVEILAGSKFDIRIYSKIVSDAAIAELYNNIVLFEGKKVLPGF